MTAPAQGLPGWLVVHYGEDGPIVQDEEYERPDAAVEVHIDTAYGYRTDNGAGCGDLHAWFISCVGAWLNSRGVQWEWKDEFTGDRYDTIEDVKNLGDPVLGAL